VFDRVILVKAPRVPTCGAYEILQCLSVGVTWENGTYDRLSRRAAIGSNTSIGAGRGVDWGRTLKADTTAACFTGSAEKSKLCVSVSPNGDGIPGVLGCLALN
jgi:hypothetical protein